MYGYEIVQAFPYGVVDEVIKSWHSVVKTEGHYIQFVVAVVVFHRSPYTIMI